MIARYSAEQVWQDQIQEGGTVAMEVGMHRAQQYLQAVRAGMEVHCIEPSSNSFNMVKTAEGLSRNRTSGECISTMLSQAGRLEKY
jgi:hypothetical protein